MPASAGAAITIPFSVLERHFDDDEVVLRVFNPHATEVFIAEGGVRLQRPPGSDFFQRRGEGARLPERYRLIWRDEAHYEVKREGNRRIYQIDGSRDLPDSSISSSVFE
jgi:hypothetical protein